MLDRFDLVLLTEPYRGKSKGEVPLVEIQDWVEKARELEGATGSVSADADLESIPEVYRVFQSRRRERALVTLARGLALLDGESAIKEEHWTEAFLLSQKPIQSLQALFS